MDLQWFTVIYRDLPTKNGSFFLPKRPLKRLNRSLQDDSIYISDAAGDRILKFSGQGNGIVVDSWEVGEDHLPDIFHFFNI